MKKWNSDVDITVILGIIGAWSCVVICLILEGNKLSAFLSLSAFILVIGGSLGATMVGFKPQDIFRITGAIMNVIRPKRRSFDALIEEMRELAVQARRGGVLSLERNITQLDDEFIKTGLQLVVDGADSEMIQKILETKAVIMAREKRAGDRFFETMGGYTPTLGIIGTVLGLVKVLGHLSEPEKLGEGIAEAFVATLYGISSANLIFLPLAAKIKANASIETIYYEMVQEGILSIHAGDNPIMLVEKLNAYRAERMPSKEKERDDRQITRESEAVL
jgi:chemotaxis protein MotA